MDELKEQEEKTYRAIGRFIFEFSQTEYTIREGLQTLLQLDRAFFDPVIQSYDVALLCNVTKRVAGVVMSAPNVETLNSLLNGFMEFNQERLRVAHGLWIPYFGGGMVSHVGRNKLAAVMHRDQTKSLEARADALANLRTKLHAAFSALTD